MTLNYTSSNAEERTKKAAILIGGNILSRGLTVENLSTTVYVRSQKSSLGDTNLQMCRWFGHKKSYIDLISAYMQDHSLNLFQQISDFDDNLRNQFKEMIYKNIPAECILISLQNNPIFKATAPNKSRNSIMNKKLDLIQVNARSTEPLAIKIILIIILNLLNILTLSQSLLKTP